MSNPVHECKPPVDGVIPVLGTMWQCECDKLWRVYKAVVFAYHPENRAWAPAGPVVRLKNILSRSQLELIST